MAYGLFCTKPLSKTKAGLLITDLLGAHSTEILIWTLASSLKKYIWKCCLHNGCHCVLVSMCKCISVLSVGSEPPSFLLSTRDIMCQIEFILYIILSLNDFFIQIVSQKEMKVNPLTLDLFWIRIVLKINKSFVLTAYLAKSPQNLQHHYWWAFVNAIGPFN